jgi:hypothetical protein
VRHEWTPGALVAQQEVQDAVGQPVEHLDEPYCRERGLLGGFEDDGVAGDERRSEVPAGDGYRVVPRHDHRRHAVGLVHHHVRGHVAAVEALASVQGTELRVLLQRPYPGLDPAESVIQRLAILQGHEPGDLLGMLPHLPGGCLYEPGPLGHRQT